MIGVYGGTFDPVHFGHLRPALEVQQLLTLKQVRFIPCRQPPHRDPPIASAAHRLAMVRAAIEGQAGFIVDERELHRSGPSYMVDTLLSLAEEFPRQPLCLIIGMDAFVNFDKWHQWQRIIELAHLVVTERPGTDHAQLMQHAALGSFVSERRVSDARRLAEHNAGLICFVPVTQLDISATAIRQAIAAGQDIRYLVPDSVYQFIQQQQLYTQR